MDKIIEKLLLFKKERGWGKHHSGSSLAQAVIVEAAELLELFEWGKKPFIEDVSGEIADIAIYILYLCDRYGIDFKDAINTKIEYNKIKYPVDINHAEEKGWKNNDV